MKKIFFICTNPIENLDFLAPLMGEDSVKNDISVLFLQKKHGLENAHVSQVWNLSQNTPGSEGEQNSRNISYQDFLEKVFSHDLPVVI